MAVTEPYYQDDQVTIYNCDWREVVPVEADLVLTDPPYGISIVKSTGIVGWRATPCNAP